MRHALFSRPPGTQTIISKPESGPIFLDGRTIQLPQHKALQDNLLGILASVKNGIRQSTSPRKLIPLVAGVAFALAGCAGQIESTDFSGLHGQIIGADQAGLSANDFSDDFIYHSSVEQAAAQAQAKGVDKYDIDRELSSLRVDPRVSVRVVSGNVGAEVVRQDQADASRYEQDIPYKLLVKPTEDGQWQVEITAQDCLTDYPNRCSGTVSTTVSGQYDGTAPSVNLDQIRPAENGSGLLLTGSISDGPNGSGISSASLSTCDGSKSAPIDLKGGSSFSIIAPPVQGDNCYVARGQDSVNHEGISAQTNFTYNILVNPQLSQTPEGKLLVQGNASTNLWAPTQIHLDRCVVSGCANIDAESGITLNGDGSIMSKGIPPQLGQNKFTAWVVDKFGNTQKTQPIEIEYNLSVSASAQVESNGSITVKAEPKTNMLPSFTVEVRPGCDGETAPITAIKQNDGSFSVSGIVPHVGNNCEEVIATDTFGQRVLTQTSTDYQFGPGEIHQEIQYTDKGAQLFLFGNPPDNVNVATMAVYGSQPDWRAWGEEKGFMCSPYQGEVSFQGQKWRYGVVCDLPSNAGDAKIRIDFLDKFGHQFSAFYPNNTQYTVDLKDDPPFNQLALFLAPYLAGALATVASGSLASYKTYGFADERLRKGRAKKAAGLALEGNVEAMESLIYKPRRVFKVTEPEARIYRTAARSYDLMKSGKLTEAVEMIGILDGAIDSRKKSALYEIRRIMLNSALEKINARLTIIESQRRTHLLTEREAHSLVSTIKKLSDTPVWAHINPATTTRALMFVSSFHIASQAYCMNPRDFVERHSRLLLNRDQSSQRGRYRMVTLLCHWRQFTALEEFIKRIDGAEKNIYMRLYRQALKEVKDSFVTSLSQANEQRFTHRTTSATPHLREALRGMRLGKTLEEELNMLVDLHTAIEERDNTQSVNLLRSFLHIYPHDQEHVLRYVPEIGARVTAQLDKVVGAKDPMSLQDSRLISLVKSISQDKDESWWLGLPVGLRTRVESQIEELLMVHLARTQHDIFMRQFSLPPHLNTSQALQKTATTLSQWKDFTSAIDCVESLPVSGDRNTLRDWYENEYLYPLRKAHLAEIRKKGSADKLFSQYRLPSAFIQQCHDMGEVEISTINGDYTRALTHAFDYISTYPKVAAVAHESVTHILGEVQRDLNAIIQTRDPSRLTDGSKNALAELVINLQNDRYWSRIRFAEKASLIAQCREICVAASSFRLTSEVFVRSQMPGYISSIHQFDEMLTILARWKNFQVATACIHAFPTKTAVATIEAAFDEKHIKPIRDAFSHALKSGAKFSTFFRGYNLSPVLENEFRNREEIDNAEKNGNMLAILNRSRSIILSNPRLVSDLQPNVEGALIKIHDSWERVMRSKDRIYLQSKEFIELHRYFQLVAHEPWWEHMLVSGFKGLIAAQSHELFVVAMAEQGADALRSAFGGILSSSDGVESVSKVLCRWNNYAIPWVLCIGFPEKKERDNLVSHFNRDYIGPLQKGYIAAMKEDFATSANFLLGYSLSDHHVREFSQLRKKHERLLRWRADELPGWRYADYMCVTDESKEGVMDDIASTCQKVMFERGLPFEDAVAVTRRWYDISYYIHGPFVPLFLGVSKEDIAAAKKSDDIFPFVAKIRKGMIPLMSDLDRLSNISNAENTDPAIKQQVALASLIHSRVMMYWFGLLKPLMDKMPVKKVDNKDVKYAPLSFLTYMAIDPESPDYREDDARLQTWINGMWELFNGQIDGEVADVQDTFSQLNIKPIIYYIKHDSKGAIEDKSNVYMI